jgi:hypothetical protein
MTIDEAKRKFARLLGEVERELNATISEVDIKRTSEPSTFNGKEYTRNDVKVTIIFE